MPYSAANKILSTYWNHAKIPVGVHSIATSMGIRIIADPKMRESGHYTPACGDTPPQIAYNPTESPMRQRFTIAHELGHFALHHGDSFRDTPTNFTMGNADPREVAANRFAAQLLMPEKILRAIIEVDNIRSVTWLADMFNVSRAAMTYRLKDLGYVIRT